MITIMSSNVATVMVIAAPYSDATLIATLAFA
jgi:hypothetical protein